MANNIVSRITSAGTYFTGLPTKIPDNVVTNGLILYLNANNPASYPGTGNTWYDLSGQGAHGTINNLSSGNITFVSAGTKSYFNFATASDLNYIGSTASQDYQDVTILFQPDFTLTNGSLITGLVSKSNNTTALDQSLRFGISVAGVGPWFVPNAGNNNDWANGSVPASGTGVVNYYNNNTLYTGQFNISSGWNVLGGAKNSATWTGNWSYFLGSGGYFGRGFQGKIAAVLMYNRALSAAEQRQNTDALLDRFNFVSKSAQIDEVSYNPISGGTIAYSATPDKRTNILKYSQDFTNASYWNVNGGSVSPNSIISPNGTQDASIIVGGSAFNGVWQGWAATAGTTYTYSVYLKYISGANECLIGPETPADEMLYVNIQNGTVVLASPNVINSGVINAGNGWYRFYGTCRQPLTENTDIALYQSWRNSTAMQFGVWGAQVETGISATPYIATDGIGSISRANTNLLIDTQNLNNIYAWSISAANLVSSITAPDGSKTAYKIVQDTTSNRHYYMQFLNVLSNTTYTFSCYAKAAENNFVSVIFGKAASPYNRVGSIVNLTTGEITNYIATGVTYVNRNPAIYVGDGWWKISLSVIIDATSTDGYVEIGTLENSSQGNGYSGSNGINGTYIWGPQLQRGNVASPYIATTFNGNSINNFTTRIDNLGDILTINDFDEVSYNKPTTNINLLYSPNILNVQSGWYTQNTTVVPTTLTAAPDGTPTAYKLIEDTTNNYHELLQYPYNAQAGEIITFSIYVKAAERSIITIQTDSPGGFGYAAFNLNTGTTINYGANAYNQIITSAGNGWYRCSFTMAATRVGTNGTVGLKFLMANGSGQYSYTGDGTSGIYIWGPQIELNSKPSSYFYYRKNLFGGTESLTNYKPIDIYNQYPWNTSAANVASTTDLDPNGNFTATTVSYGNQFTQIQTPSTGVPVASNTIYTISVSVKSTQQVFSIVTGNNAPYPTGSSQWVYYDLIKNVAQYPGASGSELPTATTITPENNGFKRCTFSVKTDATQNQMYVGFWMGGYGQAATGNTMTLFGPQIEVGNTATPYQANTITLSSKTLNGGTIAVANEIDEVTFNPPIVTDGLVLNLDPANPNSYNGGNTWNDLSGNTLSYGTISQDYSGNGTFGIDKTTYNVPVFNINNSSTSANAVIRLTTTSLDALAQSNNFTVMFAAKKNYHGLFGNDFGNSQIFRGSGNGYNFGWRIIESYGGIPGSIFTKRHTWSLGWNDQFQGYTVDDLKSDTNRMCIVAFTISPSQIKGFCNGSTTTASNPLNYLAGTGSPQISVTSAGAGSFNGQLGFFMIYNRALSDAEINQNYNALAYRYNL